VTAPNVSLLESASLPVASVERGGAEIVDRLADEWRDLCAEAVETHPFYRPEWIRAYLRAFAPAAKIVVITVRVGNRLCLVLPLIEEMGTFSKVPVRKLRAPVNFYAGRFDAICSSGNEGKAAVRAAWECLHELEGWDLLQFRDASEGSTVSQLAAAAKADGFLAVQVPDKPTPYTQVPADPALLNKMPVNSRLRTELRQVRRQLAEQGALNFYRVDTADPDALDRFYRLEAGGWKGEAGTSILGRGTRAFFDEIAESAARFGYLSLYMLELNAELLAAHFGFTYRDRYYSVIVAYDEKFKQFSPGHLMISEIVRDCAARGIRIFDFVGQDQWWKRKWTDELRPVNHHFVFRGALGRLAYSVGCRFGPGVSRLLGKTRGSVVEVS